MVVSSLEGFRVKGSAQLWIPVESLLAAVSRCWLSPSASLPACACARSLSLSTLSLCVGLYVRLSLCPWVYLHVGWEGALGGSWVVMSRVISPL